jgi:hypothetical protein
MASGDEGQKRRLSRVKKLVAIIEKKADFFLVHLTKKSSTVMKGEAGVQWSVMSKQMKI